MEGYLPILRANNIEDDSLTFTNLVWVPARRLSNQQRIRKGDVLIAMSSGSKEVVGKTAQAHDDWSGAFGAFCGVLRPVSGIDSLFFGRFLQTRYYRSKISELAAGTNINNLKSEHFTQIEIPVPPLPEQRRIVAKLEKLLDKVDSCQKRLAKIPILLKMFRESVLVAACSGQLTAGWRGENRNASSYIIDNAVGSLSDGSDCPNEWCITNLGALVKLVTSGSRGWAKYYAKSGAIFVRAQNINSDVLDLDEPVYVQLPERSEGVRTKVQLYDILITITGANVTRSALVQRRIEEAYVNQHVALVRLNDVRFSKFVFLSIISPMHGRQQLRSSAYGQGKPGLNLDNIRSVVLRLPPLSEQHEIVRRVDELFSLADQIEARFAKAKQYVDGLKQSILAKAFRGELVPQDPKDEPVSTLVERIREARGTRDTSRSRPRATNSPPSSAGSSLLTKDNVGLR